MTKKMIAIRDVDEGTFRKFKAAAAGENMNIGNALTIAMRQWAERGKTEAVPNPKNLAKIKGMIKTKEKVKWSEEVDEILYGAER